MFKKVMEKIKNAWHQFTKRRIYWSYESYCLRTIRAILEFLGAALLGGIVGFCLAVIQVKLFGKK